MSKSVTSILNQPVIRLSRNTISFQCDQHTYGEMLVTWLTELDLHSGINAEWSATWKGGECTITFDAN